MSRVPRKKPKLDFAAMVAGSQNVRSTSELVEEKAHDLSSSFAVENSLLVRTYSLCSEATVEMMLVSRLGLEGVDSLRLAIQTVPETYLEKRVPFITNILNAVLTLSGKEPVNQVQCEAFMSLCVHKCKCYTQRKCHPHAFDREMLSLTDKTGVGHAAFLAPPLTYCVNDHCEGKRLAAYTEPTNVTVFTSTGPRPATKITLKCSKCNTNYGYTKFGNRSSGERYYDEERPLVEASDVVFLDRYLHQLFASLSMHCWVSFCGFAEVMFECWQNYCDQDVIAMMRGHKFCTELSRKHVSNAYFNAELESELGETFKKSVTFFMNDKDRSRVMTEIEAERASKPYSHNQSDVCITNGCGRCWSFDGNWKLGFTHCMYPVKTTVEGMPKLNFPDVCTNEPVYGQAFCSQHCTLAKSKGIPTDLRKYLQFSGPSSPEETFPQHHPIAVSQGTETFIKTNPNVVPLCNTVSSEIQPICNKDIGEGDRLRMWSRGHFFIVRSCGHIDQWHPLYRSESPSQVFIIVLSWLIEILKHIPEDQWGDIVVSYDNMCHLDAMRAAQEPLPLPAPYSKMWKSVTKVIDELHIKNHRDKNCHQKYHPKIVKEKHPNYNLVCAEQVFAWLSRFKKITCSMNKVHHCFFLHRTISRRNRYSELCNKLNRNAYLPTLSSVH